MREIAECNPQWREKDGWSVEFKGPNEGEGGLMSCTVKPTCSSHRIRQFTAQEASAHNQDLRFTVQFPTQLLILCYVPIVG